jgi:hypothetical protein
MGYLPKWWSVLERSHAATSRARLASLDVSVVIEWSTLLRCTSRELAVRGTAADHPSTVGNLAFPFTPPEAMIGEAYRFNAFHWMNADDMARMFPVEGEKVA